MIRLLLLLVLFTLPAHADDWRAYHHGIEAVPDGNGRFWIFYSAVSDPRERVSDEAEWTHNIYVANWGNGDEDQLSSRLFIHRPGAQEPVSVARATNGNIMVTAEDGGNTDNDVDQRYGVYKSNLKPIKSYPRQVKDGGHSGHVGAVGNSFIIFYSHEWIDGGGVDDLGSGYGVYAKIYDSVGHLTHFVPVAANKREWWPVLATSDKQALLLWQSFIHGKEYAGLKFALLDPKTGNLTPVQTLRTDLQYYTYNTHYMPAIDRFLIAGTSKEGRGFAYLIDPAGKVSASLTCMPPTVREAGIYIEGNNAYTPSAEDRMLEIHATRHSLTLSGIAKADFSWAEEGSVGLPAGDGRSHWVSLDRYGLQETDFEPADFKNPSAKDLCH